MLKNLTIRLILITIIISSILAISRQLSIIISARQSIRDLETKISNLEKQNQQLESATKTKNSLITLLPILVFKYFSYLQRLL